MLKDLSKRPNHMMRPLYKVVVVEVEVRISTLSLVMRVRKKKTLTTEEDPQVSLEVFQSDWDRRSKSGGRKERRKDDKFYKKPGTPTKQHAMIPRTRWNTLDQEDQIAWSKISESAKKTILGTSDNEKGRDNNPIVVVNNHEMVFEDEEVDEDDIAQAHTSSNRSIVASVHQSDPTRRTIQANTSTLRNWEELKYQDPEE